MEKLQPKHFRIETFQFTPVLGNRFYVLLAEELKIESTSIAAIDLPKCSVIDQQLTWSPVQIKLFDSENDPKVAGRIMGWLKNRNKIARQIKILQIAMDGEELIEYELQECKITHVDFGKCNYESNDIQYITLTVTPEDCNIKILKK